jgi:hypothetical protein
LQWLTVLMAAVAVAERSCWCGGGASDDGSHRFLPFFSLFSFSLFSFLFPLSVLSSRSLFCSSLLSLYSSLFFFVFFFCFPSLLPLFFFPFLMLPYQLSLPFLALSSPVFIGKYMGERGLLPLSSHGTGVCWPGRPLYSRPRTAQGVRPLCVFFFTASREATS